MTMCNYLNKENYHVRCFYKTYMYLYIVVNRIKFNLRCVTITIIVLTYKNQIINALRRCVGSL